MFAYKPPIHRGLRLFCGLCSSLFFEKKLMTDVVFRKEMLLLGEFLKINLDICVE